MDIPDNLMDFLSWLEGWEVKSFSYVDVGVSTSSLLPLPSYHTFEVDVHLWDLGTLEYQYILANPSEMDPYLPRDVLSPLVGNLKLPEIYQPFQQIQPLLSVDQWERQQSYRRITYGVDKLFPDQSCDIPSDSNPDDSVDDFHVYHQATSAPGGSAGVNMFLEATPPPGGCGDNSARDYVFHQATPLPTEYKKELLADNGRFRHFFGVKLHNGSQELVLKLFVVNINDLTKAPVDVLTMDGKAQQYESLLECFEKHSKIKQAFSSQLVPAVDAVIKSYEEFVKSNARSLKVSSDNNDSGQRLFGQALPVPQDHYRTLQVGSKRKLATVVKLQDACHHPKLDPFLVPKYFKNGSGHVGKTRREEENLAMQTFDLEKEDVRNSSAGRFGESGYSSSVVNSSFNQARCTMEKEEALYKEIAKDQLMMENPCDEEEDSDDKKV